MANGDGPVTGLPNTQSPAPKVSDENKGGAGPVTGLHNPGVKIDGKGTSKDPFENLRSTELKAMGIAFVKGKAQNIIQKLIGGFKIGNEGGNSEDNPPAIGTPTKELQKPLFAFGGLESKVQKVSGAVQDMIFGPKPERYISPATGVEAGDTKSVAERMGGLGTNFPVSVIHAIMQRWAASNPDHYLFVVRFDIPPAMSAYLEFYEPEMWRGTLYFQEHLAGAPAKLSLPGGFGGAFLNKFIPKATPNNGSSNYQPNLQGNAMVGWFFVHGATLPGETLEVRAHTHAESNSSRGGLVMPSYMLGRRKFEELGLKIYESNASFIDAVIRPWMAALAHASLIARPDGESLKTTITVTCLTRAGTQKAPVVRKEFTYYNAYPVSVGEQSLTYEIGQQKTIIDTKWAYSNYSVSMPKTPLVEGLLYSPACPPPVGR